jgi:hypothetical protein
VVVAPVIHSFVLARLGWTILGALASQGSRQPHIGGTGSARRAAPARAVKRLRFGDSIGGSKSAFNALIDRLKADKLGFSSDLIKEGGAGKALLLALKALLNYVLPFDDRGVFKVPLLLF